MQDQWLPVLDRYLPIPLSHIFNLLREDICQRVDLVRWVCKKPYLLVVYIYASPWETTELPGGIEYHPTVLEIDRVSTFTGLDDYDTMFEARHGRGALDHVPRKSKEMIITSSMGVTPTTSSVGLMVNPLDKVKPTIDIEHSSKREHVSVTTDPLKHRVVSPSSEIIGEGAAIFTDMMETILNTLDQQMAMSSDTQKLENIPIGKDLTNR